MVGTTNVMTNRRRRQTRTTTVFCGERIALTEFDQIVFAHLRAATRYFENDTFHTHEAVAVYTVARRLYRRITGNLVDKVEDALHRLVVRDVRYRGYRVVRFTSPDCGRPYFELRKVGRS